LYHLQNVSSAFVHDLSNRVDVKEYSQKLFSLAEREEAWSGDNLIGLVAYYINYDTQKAFITNVSVDIRFQKQGVATKLLENAKCVAIEERMKLISLEAANDDELIAFYLHNGFVEEKQMPNGNKILIKNLVPIVVIRCTVYNHEPYLRDCLEGFVMQQTNFPFVAIVHDDASIDGSAAIIREYEEKYPDIIKPIYEKENQWRKGTLTKVMNVAIEATGAKYVAMCEGDDFWTDPLKLQKQVDILESNPDYSMCYTDYTNVNAAGELIVWSNREKNVNRSFTEDSFAELLKGNYIQTCTILYRKTITDDKEYQGRLDYELSLQCALKGNCFFMNAKTASYRIQPNSVIHTMGEKIKNITNDVWRRYVNRYLMQKKYKRALFQHIHIMSIITAQMISMIRTKKHTEREIVDAILKANHILYVYMPLGTIIRFCNVVRKKLSLR
jgi:glycosyltransferase involved in cell wall biosynthesis/GNAT superfamily N-acetyltransferase